MKRDLHKLVALLAILFLPFALFAQTMDPAYGIVIDESFEKGIPADWTQENVSGSISWVAESTDLAYPNTASDSLARVAFRNTTGVTQKAVTRLILPVKDISGLFQPILIFSHAQDKWSGDFDSLRVVCRTSPDGPWNTLTSYRDYISKWQRDTIFLPAQNYVQIAFEGVDNLGRGIVIDDVVMRSTPSCFAPEDLYTSNVTNHSIMVNWMGSFDAEYFYVKLSRTPLTDNELADPTTELVCDTTTEDVSILFDGLNRGTRYYCYVKSQCEHEISGWVSIEFKTANIATVPDTILFEKDPNVNLASGTPYFMEGWYYEGSHPDYKPYGNAYLTDSKSYSSPSSNASLVFTNYIYNNKLSYSGYLGALPEGSWAYAATPEFPVDVKDLQITFQTVRYCPYDADQFSIIVGVMDDPEDRSTFTPIKTIHNTRQFIKEEYVVTFENYTGSGRYIAFMSEFEKPNHFNIDNLIIEPRKDKPSVQYDVIMPTASSMQFKFEQQFDSFEVAISSVAYQIDRNTDEYPDSLGIFTRKVIKNMETIEGLNPGTRYYIFARGFDGEKRGVWTLRRQVNMPSRLDVTTFPYFMDFSKLATTTVVEMNGYTASSVKIPKIVKPLFTYGSGTFKVEDSTTWIPTSYKIAYPISKNDFAIACYYPYEATTIAVFPEVEDMTKTKVSFYGVARYSSVSTNPVTNVNYKSKAVIGCMTDANDMNSFIPIDTIEPSYLEYDYYEYDFSSYPQTEGKFFAIKMEPLDFTYTTRTSYTNKIHVTNMVFAKSLDCKAPSDIQAEVDLYDPSKATITWEANGVTEWNVRVAETEYNKDRFLTEDTFEFIYNAKVTSPKVEITGLEFPYHKYYYWIQPVCEGTGGEWTVVRDFETFCPAVRSLPYFQNFEDAEAGSRVWTGFSADCMFTKQWTRSISGLPTSYENKYYYPYVTNTYAYSGTNSLPIFKKYSTSSRNYVALPEFDKPIDSLQISFRLMSLQTSATYWKTQEIAIGVMEDPMDISTFEQIATVVPTKKETWERIALKFDGYTGQGKHIAICETDKFTRSPSKTSNYADGLNTDSVYIDNIEVTVAAPCDIPYDIFASDVTPNAATINWQSDAKKFIVIVTDKILAYSDLVDFDEYKAGTVKDYAHLASIISVDTVVDAHNVRVSGLSINKSYYVYVKGFCQDMYTDYAVDYTFSTFCPAMPAESLLGDFTDVETGQFPDCWFAGKTIGEFTSASQTILNFVKVNEASSSNTALVKEQGKFVYFNSTNGAINSSTGKPTVNGTYFVTPSLDIDRITKYKIKFKAWTTASYMYSNCGTNDYARSVIVGVVTNPYNFETFMPVDTIENIHRDPFSYEVYFDKYKYDLNGDTGKFVAFYSNFGIRNNIYLDDIQFELIDECPRFDGVIESTTPTSVTIKFNSVSDSYEVRASDQISTEAYLDTTVMPSTTSTSNTITITGLRNHKEYFFYARPTSGTDCREWKLVTSGFAADSLVKSLPFFDDFEDNPYTASYGATPRDWYGYYYQEGDKSHPTMSTTANQSKMGVYTYSNGAGKNVYLVSPEMNVDKLNRCYVQFDANAKGTSSYTNKLHALIIGVVSNVNDIPGSFEPIDTLIVQPDEASLWITYKYELSNYAGTGKHIAFLNSYDFNKEVYSSYAYTYFYFDNVLVDYIPSCYAPYDFGLDNATDESFDISFKHEGALKYEAMYGFSGFTMDSLFDSDYVANNSIKTMSFTGTNMLVEGLYAETKYDIYVRAICNVNDTSEWISAGTFTTLPALISKFPYSTDFSDPIENAKWKARYSVGNNPLGYRIYFGVDSLGLVADKKNMTDSALYYSIDGGKTLGHDDAAVVSMVHRYVELKEGSYNFSFDWIFPGTPAISTSFTLNSGLFKVMLMPSTTLNGNYGNEWVTADGQTVSVSYSNPKVSSLPDTWFDLSKKTELGGTVYGAFYGTDITLPLEEQWQHHTANVNITKEQEGTYMLMFFYYGTSKAMDAVDPENPRILVVDDLLIEKAECGAVSNIDVTSFTSRSVSLKWHTSDSTLTSYDVMILNEDVDPYKATETQKAYTGTASSTTPTISNLNPATTYYVYVRPTCTGTSFWAGPIEFTTDVEVPDGYTFSFEEEDLLYYPPYVDAYLAEVKADSTYINTLSMFHRWLNRSEVEVNNTNPGTYRYSKSYAYYYPQVVHDTLVSSTYYFCGRTGSHALWLGSRTTSAWMNGATVAMPYAGEFTNKRLIFYMRPFQARRSKSSSAGNEYVAAYYPYYTSSSVALSKQSRKITVGTMTDPTDGSTFVALDTIEYPYIDADYGTSTYFKTKDPSGDNGWYRAVVSLNDVQGKYVAFRYEHYSTATDGKTLNMYIDDVTIETIPPCPAPELMKVNKLKETSVEVDYYFEGSAPTTEVIVATDEDFTKVVKCDTFNTVPFTVTGLNPLTKYYLKAKVICSDLDQSDYSAPLTFETPVAICYDNNFNEEPTNFPANWKYTSSPSLHYYMNGTSQITSVSTPSTSATTGWRITPALFKNGKFSTRHMTATPSVSNTSSSVSTYWALTPPFEMDATADQHLSFDVALTEKGLTTPVDFSLSNDSNFSFAVVVVDDASYTTYKRENMTIWRTSMSKMKHQYDFESIPNTGEEYSIDLSKFKGKNIRILFYFAGRGIDLHLDNVHINTYVENEYDASTCEFCDYEDENFFIFSDDTQLGSNKFSKWEFATEDPDTMLVLNLTVNDVSETEIAATICEGDVYNKDGFTGLVQEGLYRRKFTSVGQCDSIVSLALNVVKPKLTTLADTICFGTTYTFGSKELNRTGLYIDTLVSQVTGCDSIVTLLLTVKDVIRTEQYVNICYGDTYTFGTQTISVTGKYEEVFQTASGCDSLVTLHATMLPEYRQEINAVIKKGEEYNANGFKGLTRTGEYTLDLKSVDGCDSVIVLNLTVLESSYNEIAVNICYGDSYQLGSQTITTTGQYTETFKTAEGADSVVVVNATVLPDYRQTIEATICAGEVYNENGFTNLGATGVYTQELKSVDGCDSTLTLNLTVLSGDTTRVEFTIKTTDLPYDYQGLLYYDKSTLAGTYIDTLVVETENCEEVIIHTLIVELVDAIDNVHTFDLVMVPNPVAVNGTLYINAEFSAEERDGMKVEVFNAIGQCVYVDTPSIYPIEISGLQERGMYIVRIVTGNGKSYTGKLIVE